MPMYRVNVVFRWHGHMYGPGQTLKMTEDEAAPHLAAETLTPNEPDPEALAAQEAAREASERAAQAAARAATRARKNAAADEDAT